MVDRHSGWRRRFGEDVAAAYASDASVAATAIGGSVARGWADRFSDVEVFVFWRDAPDDAQRIAAVRRSRGGVDVDWSGPDARQRWRAGLEATGGQVGEVWPYEDGEWSEHFYVDGVNVGVSGFHVETVNAWISELIDDHRPGDDAQMLAASIVHGRGITGVELLDAWRTRLAVFPLGLVRALLGAELEIDESWWSVDSLAARNDRPALDLLLVRMTQRIIRCLLAINRRYLPDPRPKWTRSLLDRLEHLPAGAADRIDAVWSLPAQEAARLLQDLFDETLDLAATHVRDLEVTNARRWFGHRRAVWDSAPPGRCDEKD